MATLDTFRRGIKPALPAEDVSRLMWCCTPYPFTRDTRRIRRHLRRYLRLGGGTVQGAINAAHDELDAAYARYRATRPEVEPDSDS